MNLGCTAGPFEFLLFLVEGHRMGGIKKIIEKTPVWGCTIGVT